MKSLNEIKFIFDEDEYQLTIDDIQTLDGLEKIKSIKEEAKDIIKSLKENPELLNEFNCQMRALKLEQIKNSKK